MSLTKPPILKRMRRNEDMKLCLKNYVHMLRYVLVVLGVLFISALIGSSLIYTNFNNAVHDMTEAIKDITDNTDLSFDRVRDAIVNSFNDVEKDQVAESVTQYKVESDMTETIDEALSGVIDNYANYATDILEVIGGTVVVILFAFLIAFIIQIIAIFLSGDIVYYYSRRDIDKKNIFLLVIGRIVNTLVSLVILAVIAFVLMYLTGLGIILVAVYPFVAIFVFLLLSWMAVNKKKDKVAFGKVVNPKNYFTLLASGILILIGSLILGAIIYNIFGVITASYIFIALMIVTKETTRINAYILAKNSATTI